MEIESDQQIRAQPYTFPADKHQNVVVPQNQSEHGEHEQVQISEEAVVTAFVGHVAHRVDVDQRAHAGHKQQPDSGKRIEQKTASAWTEAGVPSFLLKVRWPVPVPSQV